MYLISKRRRMHGPAIICDRLKHPGRRMMDFGSPTYPEFWDHWAKRVIVSIRISVFPYRSPTLKRFWLRVQAETASNHGYLSDIPACLTSFEAEPMLRFNGNLKGLKLADFFCPRVRVEDDS